MWKQTCGTGWRPVKACVIRQPALAASDTEPPMLTRDQAVERAIDRLRADGSTLVASPETTTRNGRFGVWVVGYREAAWPGEPGGQRRARGDPRRRRVRPVVGARVAGRPHARPGSVTRRGAGRRARRSPGRPGARRGLVAPWGRLCVPRAPRSRSGRGRMSLAVGNGLRWPGRERNVAGKVVDQPRNRAAIAV